MNELESCILNIEKDDAYRLLEVIKDTADSRTERVLAQDGAVYIRKYLSLHPPGMENEYRLLARLNHPALPRVHDYYELSGKGVLIEEYIQGMKLSDLIKIAGRFSEPRAVAIAKELCGACLYLHRQQPFPVIHRDIKPDNIICTAEGAVKLIDFGAAREYKPSSDKDTVYVGTIGFAPPEQFGFGQTDVRADVYGIGMTLLNMLTGKSPERGQGAGLPRPNISADIQKIIQNATQFDPAKRYGSVSSLLFDLNQLVEEKTGISNIKDHIVKIPNSIFPKHLKWPPLFKWLIMPVHLLMLLILVVILFQGIFNPSGFGAADDVIQLLSELAVFVFVLLPPYLLGFNLFNLNEKIPFFHRGRFLKKLLLVAALFVIGGALIIALGNLHSEAYKLAHNLAAS